MFWSEHDEANVGYHQHVLLWSGGARARRARRDAVVSAVRALEEELMAKERTFSPYQEACARAVLQASYDWLEQQSESWKKARREKDGW